MNRRKFITASGLLAATTFSSRADENEDDGEFMNWDKIETPETFVAKCAQFNDGSYPAIQLQVTIKPRDPDSHGPAWGIPNILKFDLVWDGRHLEIPARFWNDIERMTIQEYPEREQKKIPAAKQWRLFQAMQSLRQPRISLSAGKGTVLVEWNRGEECDSSSTFRWMISKNGTVLRHHESDFHEC